MLSFLFSSFRKFISISDKLMSILGFGVGLFGVSFGLDISL